jgi:DNA-binding transcriptional LysR family regulator
MPTINQLEHLLALEDTRHFAKAATQVHLSQPAFSRSIQSLEKQTGMILFERTGGEIRPTPAGTFLIARARQVVSESRSFMRDLDLFQRGEIGELSLGVGPFPSATLAAQVLSSIRNSVPKVSIRMAVNSPSVLLELLLKEEIDFFVADNREVAPSHMLSSEVVMQQHGHLYARCGHPLADKPHFFRDAWAFGLASVRLPDSLKQGLYQLLDLKGHAPPRLALECDDTHLLHKVALQTNTVLASTDLAARPWLASGDLLMLQTVDVPSMFANICMFSLAQRSLPAVAIQAMALFRETGLKFAEDS